MAVAKYLAQRIIDGALTYKNVIERRPDLKDAVAAVLSEKGRGDLIVA